MRRQQQLRVLTNGSLLGVVLNRETWGGMAMMKREVVVVVGLRPLLNSRLACWLWLVAVWVTDCGVIGAACYG